MITVKYVAINAVNVKITVFKDVILYCTHFLSFAVPIIMVKAVPVHTMKGYG
jgi:hypothetical protein